MQKKVKQPETRHQPDVTNVDQQAFAMLAEPHRRELQVHCYRMVGSVHDAEDLVQETFLRAWRSRETFEGRASFRAWLYRIATNLCLDVLAKRPRRLLPVTHQVVSTLDDPIPPSILEPIWLEPFPDDLLPSMEENPEQSVTTRENITLAFIAALHLLTSQQRAILILRDVLDWQAREVADWLGLTVSAVKSSLHRARTTLANSYQAEGIDGLIPPSLDEPAQAQLKQYIRAWETADIHTLMTLLKEDGTFSMPPIPTWYRGRETIGQLTARTVFSGEACGRWRLLPTQANRQPAFGLYQHDGANGVYRAYGIQVLALASGQIADITTFRDPALVSYFKLPTIVPAQPENT